MKRLLLLLLFVPSIVFGYDGDNYTISHFVSADYQTANGNKIAKEGMSYKIGQFGTYEIGNSLELKWLAVGDSHHVSNNGAEPQAEFEHLAVDMFRSNDHGDVGVMVGRLKLHYGFFNAVDHSPSASQGINQPPNTSFWQNEELFNKATGMNFYFNGSDRDLVYKVVWGDVCHKNPQPQIEYTRNTIGVEATKVCYLTQHYEFDWSNNRIRLDEIKPTETFKVDDSFWETYAPKIPALYRLTGTFTQNLDLKYIGYQHYEESWSAIYEYIIWEQLDTGSDVNFWAYLGYDEYPYLGTTYLNNMLLKYYTMPGFEVYIGKSWAYSGKIDRNNTGTNRGTETYTGFKYSYGTNWVFKGEYYDINNTQYISLQETPDRSTWKPDWNILAVRTVYNF